MPIYEYQCLKCGKLVEDIYKYPRKLVCSVCESILKRKVELNAKTPNKWGDSNYSGSGYD